MYKIRWKILRKESEIIVHSDDKFAPVSYLFIKDICLVPKDI